MSDLLEQRKWLESGLSSAYRESDKLVVSVSSAVLALSVAFVGQIKEPQNTLALKSAWVFFVVSIALVLISLVFEQRERESRILKIDKAIKKGKKSFRDVGGSWGKAVFVVNISGIVAFFLGLVALSWFLISNLV